MFMNHKLQFAISLPQIGMESALLIIIIVIIAIIIRYLFSRFLGVLQDRGIVTGAFKALIIRILDTLIIIFVAIIAVQIITAELIQYIIILIIGVLFFILFYYEIKEFIAYIALQFERKTLKTWLEIYPPNSNNVIRGKVIEILPSSSIIEDIYGNKIRIANSILLHSLIKEYIPHIQLKITVSLKEILKNSEIFKFIKDVTDNMSFNSYDIYYVTRQLLNRSLTSSIFKIDERSITLKNIDKDFLTCIVKLIPPQTPLRKSDIDKVIKDIFQRFPEKSISIEILE